MTLEQYRPCLIFSIFLIMLSSPAGAAEKLWPTDLQSHGDCLADRITAPRNEAQDRADHIYCTENNQGFPDKIQICLDNALATPEVVFFSDICREDFYISLNGIEYTLQRVTTAPKSPISFAGTYKGDGLFVTITAGKLLSKSDENPDESEPGDGFIFGEFEAFVTITRDGKTQTIPGIFSHGP